MTVNASPMEWKPVPECSAPMKTSLLLVVNPVNPDSSSMEMENVSKQLLPPLLQSEHAHGLDRPAKHGRTVVIIAGAMKMEQILNVHTIPVMPESITNVDAWNAKMGINLVRVPDVSRFRIQMSRTKRNSRLNHTKSDVEETHGVIRTGDSDVKVIWNVEHQGRLC